MSKEIYLDAPNVGALEKRFLSKAIDIGFVSTVGPFVPDFEKRFASYLGVKQAVSTQSGTAAIHMGLHEFGIGAGDEVIVPALTFVATANPVAYLGARPVFVDVDPDTWNMDPDEVEGAITDRTKAIIPVHFYGNPCDMDAIMGIAKKSGLRVIEDATESLGAKFRGRFTGTFGDLNCFSFNGNKVITTGGGGMVVGNNVKRLEHIKYLVNQARDASGSQFHSEIGFNYRMTNIEAALGIAQMERLDAFLERKRVINEIYRRELKGIRSIRFQEECDGAHSSWWLTCVLFDRKIEMSALQKRLEKRGIPTRRVFRPVTDFKPYLKHRRKECAVSKRVFDRGLCLPSSTLNSSDDIVYSCRMIKEALA